MVGGRAGRPSGRPDGRGRVRAAAASLAMLLTVVGVTTAAGYAVSSGALGGVATDVVGAATPAASRTQPREAPTAAEPVPTAAPTTPASPTAAPARRTPTTPAAPSPSPVPTATPLAAEPSAPPSSEDPGPAPAPGPELLGPGDDGAEVRELQARLRQVAWFVGDVTDHYGSATESAVRGFQAKRGIPVTGYLDQRTRDRLATMTREPTAAELDNRFPDEAGTAARLDPRCLSGRVMCVDKSSRTLRWVVGGKVRKTLDVRFGSSYTPTREGRFTVASTSRDHVSSLYDTPMPFAMFFSGGQAVHYSPDFAAQGYAGASHGCVNVRDLPGITWLFDQVSVGDAVVVYWS